MYYSTANFRYDAPDEDEDDEEEVLDRADPEHFAEDLAALEGRAGMVVKLTFPALLVSGRVARNRAPEPPDLVRALRCPAGANSD
jgi:hypothetical protein